MEYPYFIEVSLGLNKNYIILSNSADGKYELSEENTIEQTDFAFSNLEAAVNEVKNVIKAYPDFVQIVVENSKEHKWERIFEKKDGKVVGIYKLGKNERTFDFTTI